MPSRACLFCAIVAGDEPATVVLDEERLLGFLDVRPVFRGHVLLVPRVHVDTLLDLPADLHAPLLDGARRVAQAAVDGLGAQGTFVAVNNTVSQSVPHLHVHVVPAPRATACAGSSGRGPGTTTRSRPPRWRPGSRGRCHLPRRACS